MPLATQLLPLQSESLGAGPRAREMNTFRVAWCDELWREHFSLSDQIWGLCRLQQGLAIWLGTGISHSHPGWPENPTHLGFLSWVKCGSCGGGG